MSKPILAQLLNKGPQLVEHDDGSRFMLSVMSDDAGVIGIRPFAIGGKAPRRGKHYLIPAFARDDYFSHLRVVDSLSPDESNTSGIGASNPKQMEETLA